MSGTLAWHITDWREYYEVNDSGRPWRPGNKKRAGPLPFTRRHTFGPGGDNMVYAEVADFAESRERGSWPVAWGLFNKLLEIAAHQTAETRGFLLGRGGAPMSMRAMERITCFTQEQIELGLSILSDPAVRWIERRPIPGVPQQSAAVAEIRGDPRRFQEHQHQPQGECECEPNLTQHQGECEPNAESSDNDQPPSPSPPESAHADSPSHSPTTREGFLQALKLRLGWSPRDLSNAQYNGDQTTFERIASHVMVGNIGPPNPAVQVCYAEAYKIARRQGNHVAMFIAWFKEQLAANDHEWDDVKDT